MLGHKEEIIKCATIQDVAQFLNRVRFGDESAECVLTNGDLSVLAKRLKAIEKVEREKLWEINREGLRLMGELIPYFDPSCWQGYKAGERKDDGRNE